MGQAGTDAGAAPGERTRKPYWVAAFAMDAVIAAALMLCLHEMIINAGLHPWLFIAACVLLLSPVPILGDAIRRRVGWGSPQKRSLPG